MTEARLAQNPSGTARLAWSGYSVWNRTMAVVSQGCDLGGVASQVFGELAIVLRDVVGEPVSQDNHELDIQSRTAGFKIRLELHDSRGQLVVSLLVLRVLRILMLLHQPFFAGEVDLSIGDHAAQTGAENIISFAGR